MKELIKFLAPTIKAILAVIGFIVGIGWGAYGIVQGVAKAQAQVVEEKIMAVRNADFQHITGRFDRTDAKLDKIMILLEEN